MEPGESATAEIADIGAGAEISACVKFSVKQPEEARLMGRNPETQPGPR